MKINKTPKFGKVIAVAGLMFLVILGVSFFYKKDGEKKVLVSAKILPTQIPTPSVLPTPTPISFEELNKNFGPCIKVNVLMYHHIQNNEEAKNKKQTSLSVNPVFFRQHLQYLKDKNYTVIEPKDLINFFNGKEKLSGKLAMITMDDAYEDNYLEAYPILKEFGMKAVIFTPTGLIDNLDYLKWDQMNQMKDLVYFGNHTWSHHSASGTKEILNQEISWADKQLAEKGFNDQKVFAYPYGGSSIEAINILKENNYNLAFTTKHGNIMCKDKAWELPRIRVGNQELSKFGL